MVSGGGEAIVMLYGSDAGSAGKAWAPLASMGEKYALIIPDLIGYGKSSKSEETPTYDIQTTVVLDRLDREPTKLEPEVKGRVVRQADRAKKEEEEKKEKGGGI